MNAAVLAVALSVAAPPVVHPDEVWRFPADPIIKETRARGEAYRVNLLALMAAEPLHAEHALAYAESVEADEAWAVLWMVRPGPVGWETPPGPCAVLHLTRLRELLGPAAYNTGCLPPICPPHRHTPIE